eukprot:742315-Amphidinium_carterae.2
MTIDVVGVIVDGMCVHRNKQPKTDLGGDSASAISDDEDHAQKIAKTGPFSPCRCKRNDMT